MRREPFYEVPVARFLHSDQTRSNRGQPGPEEPVRQWCAFELIRAYGIPVGDLEFEPAVQIGSKRYRIDILVKRGGKPWAVIECKEPKHSMPAEGMAQAISYADSQGIMAAYAVYTNGRAWLVQRRIRGRWIAVTDLPETPFEFPEIPVSMLLSALHDAAPLLHKLDERIEGKDVLVLWTAMQRFFYGSNLLSQGNDQGLLDATDNLLRVLSIGREDPPYEFGKLEAARSSYERFRQSKGLPFEIHPVLPGGALAAEMRRLRSTLTIMAEGAVGLADADALLLRLNIVILEHGGQRDRKTPLPPIESNLHHALRRYLEFTFAVQLNIALPDTLNATWVRDMRSSCHSAWDACAKEV